MAVNKCVLLFLSYIFLLGCTDNINQSTNTTNKDDSEVYRLTRKGLRSELIEGYVHFKPASYYAHGKVNFAYELHVVNNHWQGFLLDNIQVFDLEKQNIPLATFGEEYLNDEFERRGISRGNSIRMLEGNQFGIARLLLSVDKGKSLPKQIFHRLNFKLERTDGTSKDFPMDVAITEFPEPTKLTLPLPFKKGVWFYGASSHKGSRIITEGKASYPQRFALDWMYVEEDGTIREGELEKNESYPTHGVEILAVANGIVVALKDSIPENVPHSDEMAITMTRETASGNSITIDIGNNIYAHYAHFIPNSLKVKLGDKVSKGQVIGLLGNSGSSTGPHLHFHLETASKYPLGGEGIPYHLQGFDQYISFEDEEWPKWDSLFLKKKIHLPKEPLAKRTNELPIANGFVKFE